jgi:hypothetical protein
MTHSPKHLRPFFSYFGGKWTLAPRYPTPEHDVIVEPFAGSAGYATRYPDRDVVLIERAPHIAALWRWLIGVSVDEVMALPSDISDLSDLSDLSDQARTLIMFWCARGRTRTPTTISSWMTSGKWPASFWGVYARDRIAAQVQAIRHWKVIEGDYTDAPDVRATWFVDPPYEGDRHYCARVSDYTALASWCRARTGLVIACEQQGAEWLPFRAFRTAKSIARGAYKEVIWTQRDTATVEPAAQLTKVVTL